MGVTCEGGFISGVKQTEHFNHLVKDVLLRFSFLSINSGIARHLQFLIVQEGIKETFL